MQDKGMSAIGVQEFLGKELCVGSVLAEPSVFDNSLWVPRHKKGLVPHTPVEEYKAPIR